jgi:hypothetical protein
MVPDPWPTTAGLDWFAAATTTGNGRPDLPGSRHDAPAVVDDGWSNLVGDDEVLRISRALALTWD